MTHRTPKVWSACALVLALALPAPVFAQEDADAPEEWVAQLDRLSVYATRNPLEAFDFPGSVTVLGREEMDALQASTASDLFEGVPGLRFEGGPRRTGQAPVLRGSTGAGVLVLFDGARQSFVSTHDGRFFVEPDLLQTVEVLRGPSSALYGSGAIGGVLALRTARARDLLGAGERAGVRLRLGGQGVQGETSFGGSVFARSDTGAWDALASLSFRESGDIELGNDETLPADDEMTSGLLKGSVRVSENLEMSASYLFYEGDSMDPNNPQNNHIVGDPFRDDPRVAPFVMVDPLNVAIDQVHRAVESETLRGGLHFDPERALWNLSVELWSANNRVREDSLSKSSTTLREVETRGAKIENHSQWGDAVTLSYGVEWYEDEQRGTDTGDDSPSDDDTRGGVPDASSEFLGVYAQAVWETESTLGVLRVIPGLRYDDFDTTLARGGGASGDSETSLKAGVSFEPRPWLMFFGNYAEAFRAPSFNELFASGVHFQANVPLPTCGPPLFPPPAPGCPPGPPPTAPVLIQNRFAESPGLAPEDSSTLEFGLGLNFDHFAFKGSYWDSDVKNFIDQAVEISFGGPPHPNPVCTPDRTALLGTTCFYSVPEAQLEGVELEAHYERDTVYARATWSSIAGTNARTGAHLGALTPDRLFVDAGVRLPSLDLRTGVRATFARRFDDVNEGAGEPGPRAAYETFDWYATWAPADGALAGLRLDLGVDNLTDEAYEVVADGAYEAGRNFKATLGWRAQW